MTCARACEPLLKRCCDEVRDLPGVAAEIGVYLGESAAAILRYLPNTLLHLFDTFDGMPAGMITPGLDTHTEGSFPNPMGLSYVRIRLEDAAERCIFHPGIFPATARDYGPWPLKFVHIDCDLYLSTKAAIEWAAKQLVVGGVILDDDYNCGSCPGAKRAIDEFMAEGNGFSLELSGTRAMVRRATYTLEPYRNAA